MKSDPVSELMVELGGLTSRDEVRGRLDAVTEAPPKGANVARGKISFL